MQPNNTTQTQDGMWLPPNASERIVAVSPQLQYANPDDVARLKDSMSDEQALAILTDYLGEHTQLQQHVERPNICSWAERSFYLAPGSSTESHARIAMPIRLFQHQKALLNFFFHHPVYKWVTILFSTVKKSGKTAIGGLVARYFAENSGFYAEVYCMANDEEQARGRIYKAAVDSIQNTPGYDEHKNILLVYRDTNDQLAYIQSDPRLFTQGPIVSELGWRIIDREAQFHPTKSFLRALAHDFRGESGANPTATVWSEIWGLVGEKSRKLWAELTPVPTRESIRFVETYAGYEGESDILMDLWNRCQKEGRRITKDEMPDWPWDEDPPVWINEAAQTCGYIDQGVKARRMPWQTPQYYAQQAHELAADPVSYNRFHFNEWASTISELMPIQLYFNCDITREVRDHAGNLLNEPRHLPPLKPNERMILAIDAAVSNDYCAAALLSRTGARKVGIRDMRVWKPPKGGKIDLTLTVESYIRWCAAKYNIAECCYDSFQMEKMAADLEREYVVNMVVFSQGSDRMVADQELVQCFAERDIEYDTIFTDEEGNDVLEMAIRNAAAEHNKKEDTKLRIIKRSDAAKIDPLIALSMGNHRARYLNLW
jgi:hypothetical protein